MDDLGDPSSYLALQPGPSVYSCDGDKVGSVEHVMADVADDIFEGIVLDTSVLPGGHRFVDCEQVEEIFDRGVLLKIDRSAAEALPEPEKHAAAMEIGPGDLAAGKESGMHRKLSRAWDLISGKD